MLLFFLTKALPVVAAVPMVFAWRAETGKGRFWLIILAVVIYGVSFGVDCCVKYAEKRRKEAKEDTLEGARSKRTREICYSFNSIPQYTTDFYSQISASDSSARPHLDRYLGDILGALARSATASEVRVCLYRVDRGEARKSGEGNGNESISLILFGNGVGRADPPRPAFDSTSDHGRFLIQCMNERRSIRVQDTEEPPSNYRLDCSDKKYKSFIAVPVTYNDHEYGMLMLDSPDQDGLTPDDEVVALLFGKFLGSGFHLVESTPASRPRLSGPSVSVATSSDGGV
ncbi:MULTISPECIES: GAF domain-containing protein [Tsukamurella]|nr:MULTISPECIES: GAF domain-containing protein [Tsukamurella]NMD55229.1 GAF domain-containing protein [Tsukamurella columbiensis]